MTNFFHFLPTFKSAIISNMNLKFLVFNIEDSSVMTSTVKAMKNLLQLDLVTELEKVNINIIAKIKQLFYKLFVETFWWKVMYQMAVVGRPLLD